MEMTLQDIVTKLRESVLLSQSVLEMTVKTNLFL